jgi:pimeloyl-ACP methyl ester carboxylesterase
MDRRVGNEYFSRSCVTETSAQLLSTFGVGRLSCVPNRSRALLLYYKTFFKGDDRQWVTFVHGAGGSSAVWFKQLRAFRECFNVLLLDLRGHGKSRDFHGEDGSYSIPSISRDIIEVMDHLEIESAHFVGVSLGTILVRCLGEIEPGRVQSMILAGAVTGFNLWARFLILVGQVLKHVVPFTILYRSLAWIIMPGERAKEARQVFAREARQVVPAEFKRWMRLTSEVNGAVGRWARERVAPSPTLFLMGGHDYIFLPAARECVARQKDAFLHIIEDAGHVCNVDCPEAFNRRALSFAKTHGS